MQQKLNKVRAAMAESAIGDDGLAGDETTAAIRQFQALSSLKQDGQASPATRAQLEQFVKDPTQIVAAHHRNLQPLAVDAACLKGLKTKRVAVVGAGLAGLAAALRLAQHGIQVTVYEARTEVGGRVRSNYGKFSPGRVIEEGAELIGSFHTTWLSLARDYGLGVITRTDDEDYARAGLKLKLRLDKELTQDEIRELTPKVDAVLKSIACEAALIQNVDCPWKDQTPPPPQKGPKDWDKMSVADALDQLHVPRNSRVWKMLELLLVNDEVAPLEQMNYLGLLCKVKGGQAPRLVPDELKKPCDPTKPKIPNLMGYWEELEIFRCADGCQALALKMAQQIEAITGKKIVRQRAVTSISLNDRGAFLVTYHVTKDGKLDKVSTPPELPFDSVILAVPPSVWRRVTITRKDKSPVDLRVAVGVMTMGPAIKCFSAVKKRFWLDEGAAPSGGTPTLGQIWEGTDNQTQTGNQGIVLSVFAGPLDTDKDGKRRAPMKEKIGDELAALYRDYRASKPRLLYVDWPIEPFIETGYWSPKPDEIFTVGPNLTVPIEGRLFLAGEHTDVAYFGYMEGALRSGLRAADNAMLRSCGRRPPPCGGPTVNVASNTPQRGAATAETWADEAEPELEASWTAEGESAGDTVEAPWDAPAAGDQREEEQPWDVAPEFARADEDLEPAESEPPQPESPEPGPLEPGLPGETFGDGETFGEGETPDGNEALDAGETLDSETLDAGDTLNGGWPGPRASEFGGPWHDVPEAVTEFPHDAPGPVAEFSPALEAEDRPGPAHMAFSHILLESLDPATGVMLPGVVPATPAALTTPFYDAAAKGTQPDPTLQQALTSLIAGKAAYKSAGTNLAVALVDLSGANKAAPKYAGFNDLANFYGGSVNKITGLLGVYQLLAEANEVLKAQPAIGDAAGLESELKKTWTQAGIPPKQQPQVAQILIVQAGSPAHAKLRPELVARLNRISKGNENGSTPLVLLKFPYVNSTLLAHGLFSPQNGGGLWTRMAYGKINYLGRELAIPAWPAGENPYPKTAVHNVNAVSVAQFYTLAAQHRMIDAATSTAVLRHLQSGGCTTVIDMAALYANGQVASKCGIFNGWVHNTLHFKETATLREFVIVILTKNRTFGIMKELFKDLVALVP